MGFVLPEARLVRETIWPPNGVQPTTPVADIVDRAVQQGDSMAFVVSITCADPGASIGYRLGTDRRFTGSWNVYDGPFEVPANRRFLEVQTHRIGHKPAITNAFLGGE